MYADAYRARSEVWGGLLPPRLNRDETATRTPNAVAPLRRAIELLAVQAPNGPDYIDANVKFAEIMLLEATASDRADANAKTIDEVRAIKDMLLKKNPNSFEGTKLLGELTLNDALNLYRKGKQQEFNDKMDETIAVYRKALTLKPGDSTTMLALAKTLVMHAPACSIKRNCFIARSSKRIRPCSRPTMSSTGFTLRNGDCRTPRIS